MQKSVLKKEFPHLNYPGEDKMPEEDLMFDPEEHESNEHLYERVRDVFETVWTESDPEEHCESI